MVSIRHHLRDAQEMLQISASSASADWDCVKTFDKEHPESVAAGNGIAKIEVWSSLSALPNRLRMSSAIPRAFANCASSRIAKMGMYICEMYPYCVNSLKRNHDHQS